MLIRVSPTNVTALNSSKCLKESRGHELIEPLVKTSFQIPALAAEIRQDRESILPQVGKSSANAGNLPAAEAAESLYSSIGLIAPCEFVHKFACLSRLSFWLARM